jgi:hypothetical protein
MQEEIIERISYELCGLRIGCPECEYIDDEQYHCTTCGGGEGHGTIRILDYLKEHKDILEKL